MRLNRDFELAINLFPLLGEEVRYQPAKELATVLDTTELFLQGIVLKLRKAGLVETLSGGSGGVRRAPGKEISALDVLKALGRVPKSLNGTAGKVLTNILNSLKAEAL